ncbi:uncharacterized protein APUU_60347A [Aspergillus puulaauensis]|uniref:Fungal-specific transcription factor domain-containing protein n=1 Tax=Aspergillus puulaauensis TaxID=1220207 RepID=A0A7R7XV10_9EURO|nr:uncharacterized protein APUU_60347A [Aspergillus puulaauensis]BCS27299.1 hypothetical protein APUU_60347A [Aspergillus puulaauensis]
MSTALQSSLASASVGHTLEEVERLAGLPLVAGESIFVGPFGVLGLKTGEPEENTAVASQNGVLAPADDNPGTSDTMSMMLPSFICYENLDLTDICLDWPDLFGMDSLWQCPAFTPPPEPSIWHGQVSDGITDNQSLSLHPMPPPFELVGIEMPEVETLLFHYRQRVICDMFSFPPHDKSPMEIMNAASAVVTLANIRYMGTERLTHASMENLLATRISNSAYAQGQAHMKHSLTVELRQSRPPKYKDQLMALSAMLGFATTPAPTWLTLNAFYASAALPKGLYPENAGYSTVYTWNRILTESASVLYNKPGKGQLDGGWISIPQHGQPPHQDKDTGEGLETNPRPSLDLDDFLRLGSSSICTELGSQRDHGSSLNDIHLEDSREDAKALYRQLYGKQSRRDAALLDSIQKKKQWLEDMIWKLAATGSSGCTGVSKSEGKAEQSRWYMVKAFNQGLLIFFYRRIQYLDPRLLQAYVTDVIQSLRNSKAVCRTHNVEGSGHAWPAFMAGCEAISQTDRDFVSSWMDQAYSKTGFRRFKTCKECMEMVWQRRSEAYRKKDPSVADPNWSWIDICREQDLHLMLS